MYSLNSYPRQPNISLHYKSKGDFTHWCKEAGKNKFSTGLKCLFLINEHTKRRHKTINVSTFKPTEHKESTGTLENEISITLPHQFSLTHKVLVSGS